MFAQFCHCGAQAGYPHDPYCPRPLFTGTEPDEQWVAEWNRRVELDALGFESRIPEADTVEERERLYRLVDRTWALAR